MERSRKIKERSRKIEERSRKSEDRSRSFVFLTELLLGNFRDTEIYRIIEARHRIWPGEGSTVQWKWSPPSPGGAELPPFISIVQYPGRPVIFLEPLNAPFLNGLFSQFLGTPPWWKTAPLKRPIKRSMNIGHGETAAVKCLTPARAKAASGGDFGVRRSSGCRRPTKYILAEAADVFYLALHLIQACGLEKVTFPNPPILVFFAFLAFWFCGFPCFFVRFYSLFQGFQGFGREENPCFFSGDPRLFAKKNKDWRVRVENPNLPNLRRLGRFS